MSDRLAKSGTLQLTPGPPKGDICVDPTHDGISGRDKEKGGLSRPHDLHAVVEHAAAEADQHQDIVPAENGH